MRLCSLPFSFSEGGVKKKKIGKVWKVIREEKAWIGMRFYNGWSGEWGIGCLSFIDEDENLA